MNGYKVEVLSERETENFLKMRSGPTLFGRPVPDKHRRILTAEGFELKGRFSLTARDAKSGEVEWEHAQDNLITDYGRAIFWTNGWANSTIAFAPSKDTPIQTRDSLATDAAQCFVSSNLGGGVVTPATYTKQYTVNFNTPPASTRTLGTICLCYYTPNAVDASLGVYNILAYALLTPAKTQTTTQTLEVVYKVSMNPIF